MGLDTFYMNLAVIHLLDTIRSWFGFLLHIWDLQENLYQFCSSVTPFTKKGTLLEVGIFPCRSTFMNWFESRALPWLV